MKSSLLQAMGRGALIVIEGGDRCGKTTFARNLVSLLESHKIRAKYMNYPNRNTEIGKLINAYLQSKDSDFSDETIHLLFSANRWEKVSEMKKILLSGTTLVIDRYAFSGASFSTAKDLDWCKSPDVGLPKPDLVYYLQLDTKTQVAREGFGKERYEVSEFQEKVTEVYKKLIDSSWELLDASRSTDEILSEISSSLMSLVEDVRQRNLDKLWVK
ncbi:thymidylate kinase isoform X2 [Arctopsyche grandis]|uniref:thymidylate kinase isoform X2 n=1 Tax=Arctopsyche grandis TaxID=121162 RepID=UPI00406D63E0